MVLWRHRQGDDDPSEWRSRVHGGGRVSISRDEAATRLGIRPLVFHRLESDRRTPMSVEDATRLAEALDPIVPTLGESCFLARRRSGLTLSEICDLIGVTRPTFYLMERDGDLALVRLWQKRGFVFGGVNGVD